MICVHTCRVESTGRAGRHFRAGRPDRRGATCAWRGAERHQFGLWVEEWSGVKAAVGSVPIARRAEGMKPSNLANLHPNHSGWGFAEKPRLAIIIKQFGRARPGGWSGRFIHRRSTLGNRSDLHAPSPAMAFLNALDSAIRMPGTSARHS